MAAAPQRLRQCLCGLRGVTSPSLAVSKTSSAAAGAGRRAAFSTQGSSLRAKKPAKGEEISEEERRLRGLSLHQFKLATLKGAELEEYLKDPVDPGSDRALTSMAKDMYREAIQSMRISIPVQREFFNEDEEDDMYRSDELADETFEEDDFSAVAHEELDEVRDRRQWARIAAWEMPLLAKYAQKFEPPRTDQPLRWRYTTYMGEDHPAERKVVVEFRAEDLELTGAQQLKLKKLVGARFNGATGIIKMTCESFDHPAQNKRYLQDVVKKLIEEAKDPKDMFEDVPLDNRHWKAKKVRPRFPKEWLMTEERKRELAAYRGETEPAAATGSQHGLLGESAKTSQSEAQGVKEAIVVPAEARRWPQRQL